MQEWLTRRDFLVGSALVAGVADMGAVGDARTDNTAAFQRALDEAGKAGGGVVHVPAGHYRLDGTLRIPEAVTLQGTYRVPPTAISKREQDLKGSTLFAYAGRGQPDSPPFITLAGNNSSVRGFVIAYPEWRQEDVPPVPYPPCIQSMDTLNVGVEECCLLNPYEGIKLVRAHRHLLRNLTGYPIRRGIYVDECYDIGRIENIHFWPFGVSYDPNNPYCKWINTEGAFIELGRTDWHYVLNTFCFGYGIGYHFSETRTGSTNGNFLGLGADSCQRAVVVDQCQPPGLLITNGEFVGRWSSTDAVCVEVGPRVEGKVSLVNCSFWGPIDRCVWMRSPHGQFTANACNFVHWDIRGRRAPAIQIDAGRAMVQGSTFGDGDLHVRVGPRAISAILMGNQATSGFMVDNLAGARTQMLANEGSPVAWTRAARAHYVVTVGAQGDGVYLRGWHARQTMTVGGRPRAYRWSMAESEMLLPVNPDRAYDLEITLSAPEHALSATAGVYLGRDRIVAFTRAGEQTLRGRIPAQKGDRAALRLRCQGWVPRQRIASSQDDRTLGVQAFSIRMRATGAPATAFNANTGQ